MLRATVNTYLEVDYLLLGMPEWRQWSREYERAWQVRDRMYRVSEKVKLADVDPPLRQARDVYSLHRFAQPPIASPSLA